MIKGTEIIMKEVLTAAEVKKREQFTIEQLGIPSVVLMERAALFVCSLIPSDEPKQILIISSYGNNGADGLAAARILAGKGHSVTVLMIGDSAKSTQENKLQQHILTGLSSFSDGAVHKLSIYNDINQWKKDAAPDNRMYDVIVDALFGIGLNRELQGDYLEAVRLMNNLHNEQNNLLLSVDLPSGLHADSGNVLGEAVRADVTATFQWMKAGMLLGKGPEYCGSIRIGEIDIYDEAIPGEAGKENRSLQEDETYIKGYLVEEKDIKGLPKRLSTGNKGTFGKLLSITGSETMAGAMILSTKAAFRSGIGMVRVLSHKDNRNILMSAVPEAMFDHWDTLLEEKNGKIELNESLLQRFFEWSSILLIGCGLSECKCAEKLTEYVMRHYEKTVVADGDALNLLSHHMEWLKERKEKGYQTILTPHPVEFARLCGSRPEEQKHKDPGFCRKWAGKHGCILVAKDALTIITDGRTVFFSNSGSDALATAGSGDVLAGMIAAFSAMGQNNYKAADLLLQSAMAAYIHGKAGVYAAEEYNHYSVKAGDLPDMIPKVFQKGGI
ncbi:MAG: NAD(P)H-hydrate dehydratase [Lachnospiraceae bacterium]